MLTLAETSDPELVAATVVLAGTTLVVGIFAAWSARLSARTLKRNLLPIVVPAKPDGHKRVARFGPDKHVVLDNADSFSQDDGSRVYLAVCVRNIGTGVAVINGIAARRSDVVGQDIAPERAPALVGLMRVPRAYYIGPDETTYLAMEVSAENPTGWKAILDAVTSKGSLLLDLIYRDHTGRQLTVSRLELRWANDVDRYVARMVRYWRPRMADWFRVRNDIKSAHVIGHAEPT